MNRSIIAKSLAGASLLLGCATSVSADRAASNIIAMDAGDQKTDQITVEGQKGDFGWREVTTDHFNIYGDVSEEKIRTFAERMERIDAAMRQLLKTTKTERVTVYAVEDIDAVQKLAGRSNVGGFYVPTAQGSYIVTPLKAEGNSIVRNVARTILFHEYTHHMMLSNLNQYYPGWVTEGMAELFSTADFNDDGSVTLGATPTMRNYSVGDMNRWSVEQLLTSDSRKIPNNQLVERYIRGWALCHYLLIGGKRNGQFAAYIDKINAGVAPLDAGKQVFGDLKKLNAELETYIRQAKIPGVTFVPDSVKNGVKMDVRNLSEGEAKMMPVRLRSAVGVNAETAPKVAAQGAKIAAQYPNNAWVQRAMAEMAYDAKQLNEAEAAADRALAVEPDNLMAMVYKGRVYAKRAKAQNDPALWKEARRWFLKANKVNADMPLPFVLYYDTYVASGAAAPDAALNGLLRATVLVPQDSSINMRIGYALIQKGDLKGARTILAPVGFNPEGGEDNPAKKIIAAIDEGKSAADIAALAKKEKLDKVNDFTDPEELKDKDADGKGKGKEKGKE